MSTIDVRQAHSLGRDEARERLGSLEQMMSKYGVKLEWSGDSAAIKGMAVSGDIHVHDDDVQVMLKLGMMAKAAGVDADRLKGSIERRLKEAFEG